MKRKYIVLPVIVCLFILGIIWWKGQTVGENSDDELPVLQIYVAFSAPEDHMQRIAQQMSKITAEKLGCTIALKGVELVDYWTGLKTQYLNGRTIDIFAIEDYQGLVESVDNGWLLSLNSWENRYRQSLSDIIKEDMWQSVTFSDHIYAIPSNQPQELSMGLLMNKEICDDLGIDPYDISSYEDIYEVLKRVKSACPDISPLGSHYGRTFQYLGIDVLGDSLGVLMEPQTDSTLVENLYETNTYKELCYMMHQWYKEGLIYEKAFDTKSSYSQQMEERQIFAVFHSTWINRQDNAAYQMGLDTIEINLGPNIISTDNINLYWGINQSTDYPELAASLLELLYTDEDLIKLCIWGEENTDYWIDENGGYNVAETRKWRTSDWAWPNSEPLSKYYLNNEVQRVIVDPTIYYSSANGFVFDSTPVKSQTDSCNYIVQKYNNALLSGYLDPDEALPLFLDELKKAGIDDIVNQKQHQLDYWLAEKATD